MKRSSWTWLAGAFVAIPAMFAALAFVDARFEYGVLHSTWKSGVALFGAVSVGLYLLWQCKLRARWQYIVLMLAYAPTMFAVLAWLGVVIQLNFDDCMVQQAVAADRPKTGANIADVSRDLELPGFSNPAVRQKYKIPTGSFSNKVET